ncbi:MAG: fructose-bisphosphate aldolase [Armatimonadetes bacterium]|nr:fructose-bisphosphate aldolase [Armatimonadota bacterium]
MTLAAGARRGLDDFEHLSLGKRVRLRNLFGGSSFAVVLDYARPIETGPRAFDGEAQSDPDVVLDSALKGAVSATALNVGVALRYWKRYAGKLSLILKLNGRADLAGEGGFAACHASVEDAVRLGADAAGYVLSLGSPAQEHDFVQFSEVREEAERYGLPLIVWAAVSPAAVAQRGGPRSPFAVEYAARVAQELGADVVVLETPSAPAAGSPPPYDALEFDEQESLTRAVAAAGETLVWFSPPAEASEDALEKGAALAYRVGAAGYLLDRALWGKSDLASRLRPKRGEDGKPTEPPVSDGEQEAPEKEPEPAPQES